MLKIITLLSVIFLGIFSFFSMPEGRRYEENAKKLFVNLGKKKQKELGIEFLGCGSYHHVDAGNAKWSLSFIDRRAVVKEDGRETIVNLIDSTWKEMQSNKAIAEYYKFFHEDSKDNPDPYYHLTEESFGIRLAYWDENTDRREFPYLAQIRVADGDIYYYYADPKTQALGEPIRESFSEARSVVKASP